MTPLRHPGPLRFVQLAESGIVGVCIGNVYGKLLDANDSYLSLLGFSRDEFEAGFVKWSERMPPEWAEAHRAALDSLKRTGAAAPWEAELIRRDGHRVPVMIAVGTLDYPNTVTLVTDLTPVRATEGRLWRTEERLRHAQKMEALGALAGGMAHEFNNLLSVILGYTGMLAADLEPADPMLEVLDEIRTAGERAAALTRQLLTFSRNQLARTSPLDLNDVVKDASDDIRRVAGDTVELVLEPAPLLPTVHSDAEHVRDAIAQLVQNARDAMPNGGRLIINTAVVTVSADGPATHLDLAPGDYVTLAVTDTGIGMDRTTQSRMFEPFFTTKGVGRGSGLGLSTVFGVVQQSRGSIRTESELGRGTTVKLFFPAAHAELPAPMPAEDAVATTLDGTETVLIVDDEDAVRSMAALTLRRHGYTVLEAAGATDALHTARRHPQSIHLLVTDVSLPRVAGRHLVELVRQLRPEVEVLYTSGYTTTAVVRHGVIERDAHFVQKPFTDAALLFAVRRALEAPHDSRAATS